MQSVSSFGGVFFSTDRSWEPLFVRSFNEALPTRSGVTGGLLSSWISRLSSAKLAFFLYRSDMILLLTLLIWSGLKSLEQVHRCEN